MNGEGVMARKKVKTGDVNPFPDKIERKHITYPVTIKIEGDLLDALKGQAAERGLPYQTMTKQLLRAQLGMEGGIMGASLRRLIEAIVDERLKSKRKAG
jgi:hypothetical protein